MVSGYRELREDRSLVAASEAILALRQIERPTHQQRLGAMLEAEFKLRVILHLSGGK
jgi:hypothetical protein